jgi:nicotinamidase-related amidase
VDARADDGESHVRILAHTGRVPSTAFFVIDMLNDYDHEDAEPLAASAREVVPRIAALLDRVGDETLTVYVNDNHEAWAAGRTQLVQRALDGRHPELVEPLVPRDDTPFLVKGRHSIFYETAVGHLLNSQGVRRVVLCGQVTEQCILYSSLDAYLRGFEIAVPPDAVAHIHADLADAALRMMSRNMHADLAAAADCDLVG